MNGKPAVQVPEVPSIDLDYRPHDYFWAVGLKIPLLSGIAGQRRRQLVRELVEAGGPVPDGLDAPVLQELMRQAWGRVHPSHLGGEFLPPLRRGEVEIARISLNSVTADQISVRARRSGKRTVYRIVDEYESGYTCCAESSSPTLSLRELIGVIESACDGSSITFVILSDLVGGASTPAELAAFITVTSDFYPHLGPYYRAVIEVWVNARQGGSRDT